MHIRTSAEMRRVLEQLAVVFAGTLIRTLSEARVEDLNDVTVTAGAPAARRAAARRAVAPSRRRRVASSPAPRGDVLASVVAHLRSRANGVRGEHLRRDLGLDRATFIRAISDGLATEEIRKAGRLRSTTYFAA